MLVIVLLIAIFALGMGIVEAVSLPFGGFDWQLALFWGFVLVLIALGVLIFVGRRRQRAAQAKAAEGRARRRALARPEPAEAISMCGRYSLAGPNPAQVKAQYPALESVEIRQRYNVAPGDDVLAVTTDKAGAPRGELLRWGLVPSWSKSAASGLKMINARSETVAERPAYRRSFQTMRCLIIADGFYEWQRAAEGRKHAFHIARRSVRCSRLPASGRSGTRPRAMCCARARS